MYVCSYMRLYVVVCGYMWLFGFLSSDHSHSDSVHVHHGTSLGRYPLRCSSVACQALKGAERGVAMMARLGI